MPVQTLEMQQLSITIIVYAENVQNLNSRRPGHPKYRLPHGISTPHARAYMFSHSFLMNDEVISDCVSVLLTRANVTEENNS